MNSFSRRGACPALSAPMQTGDGLLVRLNPVAGGLSPKSLIGLCESAQRHGNGIMEVTARGSIQIRGLTPKSARLLADDVNALEIAVRTGVPVDIGPLAGLDPGEIADPRPLADAIRMAIDNAGLTSRLGPKVSVVVDGGGRIGLDAVLADVRLVAKRLDGGVVWGLAVNGSAAAARALGFVTEAKASEKAVAILEAIAALGWEGRAKDLTSEQLDPILAQYDDPRSVAASFDLRSKRQTMSSTVGVLPLADSARALGIALPFGSMPAERIAALAQAATNLSATEIRPAPGRMLLVLALSASSTTTLQTKAASLGFVTDSVDPRAHIAACPGAPACASGRIATREIAESFAAGSGDVLDDSFILHVSGCAKGCAHPGTAALTLVGGESGAGLVVDGTAKMRPAGYTPSSGAARGLGRVAALVRRTRQPSETGAACLVRQGRIRIATAFTQE